MEPFKLKPLQKIQTVKTASLRFSFGFQVRFKLKISNFKKLKSFPKLLELGLKMKRLLKKIFQKIIKSQP